MYQYMPELKFLVTHIHPKFIKKSKLIVILSTLIFKINLIFRDQSDASSNLMAMCILC